MKLQRQPNNWSCLPTAFAMALDMPVERVLETVGHDGSEKSFPTYPEPFCRRSFHIQEMFDVCLKNNHLVTPVEVTPLGYVDVEDGREKVIQINLGGMDRVRNYLYKHKGVLTGTGLCGRPHAVAWDGKTIYDPNGTTYDLIFFDLDTFYVISKIIL